MAARAPKKLTIDPAVQAVMPAATSKAVKKAKETLAKKQPRINPLSQAWKALEKRVRDLLQGVGFEQAYRELRGSDLGESTFDVKLPECPHLINDAKYTQRTHKVHTVWRSTLKKYEAEARAAAPDVDPEVIIWTQEKGKELILATLDGKFLSKLLANYYLRDGKSSSDWGCPRCGGALESAVSHMGRELHVCTKCRLQFETERGKRKR